MRVGTSHLTYCTNIHPGESWAEVRANVERHVVDVKAQLAPSEPFGVGLRLSARAAGELAEPRELAAFRRFLDEHGLYVFTINGFPYGTFHGAPVKEQVYRPDWTEPERVAYTNRLADVLAALLPDGVDGSISTVPGCFRARGGAAAEAAIAANLARCAEHLAAVEARTGARIALALEPEPRCSIETLAEAAAFFAAHVRDRDRLAVCLDACHAAVEFEHLPSALAELRAAGVAVAKVQLSAGLRLTPGPAERAALTRYADEVYLHQVVARRGDRLERYVDLPEALAEASADDADDEWRVHFHVPIFRDDLGPFASTQPFLAELLALHRASPIAPHLEVETYTWDVLPPELRDGIARLGSSADGSSGPSPVATAVARELRWVLERLR
ncbi:MAG: metabolite traffic protein EboE [Deltaproteobacteria bacterium]|nr:metabolite traffic protein EboE [Deltaproteobacteria bacterium]